MNGEAMNFKAISDKIKGNVVPVPGQFNDDLSLNLSGYEEHVSFLLGKGVKLFYLALSASEFMYMTLAERIAVTSVVAKTINGKGLLLAQAAGDHWIDEQAEEGLALMDAGADAIVVKPVPIKEGSSFFNCKYTRGGYSPDRHDDHFVSYIEQYAQRTNAPIVFHDGLFKNGLGLSMDGLERIAEIDNVVCLKFHMADPCSRQATYAAFGGRIACYDGLHKPLQLWSLVWGASARHTNWSWFDPDHDQIFYDLVTSGDYNGAVALVGREWPLANAIRQTGYRGFKEVMSLMGLPGRACRIPGEELNAQQKILVANAAKEIGLI